MPKKPDKECEHYWVDYYLAEIGDSPRCNKCGKEQYAKEDERIND